MKGRVISAKMSKTATVLIERTAMHPLYRKTFLRSKNILVDDPIGVKLGDIVEIIKVKPVSKNKHWRVVKVIGKNLAEIVEAEQKMAAEQAIAEVMPEEEKTEESSAVSHQTEKAEKKAKRKEKSDS
ncbi:mitochondrial small ribosomal subunit protein uS17m [Candidatus Daviesbacteria bacterium]|nr:mitochondrial small ribosomal subunit protein uS17m [Candidatus Daviesbacteria bacterium]